MSSFQLPKLSYDYDELEPHIDSNTLSIHHGKHHATYVNNLNATLENYTELHNKSLEELLCNLDTLPKEIVTAVRNNGGGEPNGDVAKVIDYYFNTFDNLKDQLSKAAISRFGSGYGWLVLDGEELSVMSTPNQDTPLQEGKIPLLVIDVWEHAYYLKYQNRRPEFVTNWWHTVNWDQVNEKYLQAIQSQKH
ncbi:superoxide dismutase [Mn] [Bacillus cereus]|uniref:superoxide dismutase [Mn] n=1 Tax=Bacillus cereus TaxID=1396 RepID=UPI0007AB538C|nr:superoxide dismutase [Mn] [Bacillus cereus]KZD26024.1 Manganese superoxide dismutase [Bacillus cereus]MCC2396284.1 superoxide dismutase [Mn] [Bacillus cereus]MCU5660812.1 superoxide dismutase [Mn] [Bacillus cereus]MCU5721467.1 superoxide dismutase [Mn] [Bacillus cereus]